jgi:3-phenylpropionate/trans-cinnamate dioxygenase ferredoxin subunit
MFDPSPMATEGPSGLEGLSTEVKVMMVRVGNPKDVAPGQMRVFEVAGTKVNVASAGGHLYAIDDTCTHTGCSLAKGKLDATTATCACHGSQFDITSGAVLRGPAGRPVRSRSVQVEGEDLLVEA